MESIQIVYLIFFGLGLVLTLFGLFQKSLEREPIAWRDRISGGNELHAETVVMNSGAASEMSLDKMEEHWALIDKTLEEFQSTADAAITELDDKYQELLFLYSLIDEKKKEICNAEPSESEAKPVPAVKTRSFPDKTRSSHPKRKDIINLSKQGLSVAEIARELNVGQDMVSLILEMGR